MARWLAVLVPGAVLLCVGAASIRFPAGPAAGRHLEEPPPVAVDADAPRLRVAIFNIHSGKGSDGRRDLTRTADCLRGCDLVALNEVSGPRPWQDANQAATLGRTLGAGWLFAPTESRFIHGAFGNGLLSRRPVDFWQRVPLALDGAKTYRNLVIAGCPFQGRRLHVVATHLDSRDTARRQAQLRAVGDLFLALAEPALLLGDMNATREDEQMRRLLAAEGVVDCLAVNAETAAHERIDWILARGLRPTAAGMVDRGASDHPCYWVDVELAP